jgi:hypothetical protein
MLEEPGAVVPHAGILCGGCRVTGISTVTLTYPALPAIHGGS